MLPLLGPSYYKYLHPLPGPLRSTRVAPDRLRVSAQSQFVSSLLASPAPQAKPATCHLGLPHSSLQHRRVTRGQTMPLKPSSLLRTQFQKPDCLAASRRYQPIWKPDSSLTPALEKGNGNANGAGPQVTWGGGSLG